MHSHTFNARRTGAPYSMLARQHAPQHGCSRALHRLGLSSPLLRCSVVPSAPPSASIMYNRQRRYSCCCKGKQNREGHRLLQLIQKQCTLKCEIYERVPRSRQKLLEYHAIHQTSCLGPLPMSKSLRPPPFCARACVHTRTHTHTHPSSFRLCCAIFKERKSVKDRER